MPDDAITIDTICDNLVIWGSPQKVAGEILAFRETAGDFGTLLYASHNWRDPELARRSMVLAAEKVLPAVNAAIGHPAFSRPTVSRLSVKRTQVFGAPGCFKGCAWANASCSMHCA